MPCTSPLRGHQAQAGGPLSFQKAEFVSGRWIDLPCGQCLDCRLDYSRSWAIRCVHEAQMHEASSFITLTYSNENLPGMSLVYRDYQLFQKRVLKRFGSNRFFMCGEYGGVTGRPHFHACLFGVFFEDRLPWKKMESGEQLYRSALLESLWSNGHASVGSVTMQSAGYVARYVMKKALDSSVSSRRIIFDPVLGENVERVHEFSQMSLKPGIGRAWIEKYWSDVYPHGYVELDGVKMKPPRYYDKLYAERDPDGYAAMIARRAAEIQEPNVRRDGRLAAEAQVTRAKVSFLKRSID